jgi:hypothetical protein
MGNFMRGHATRGKRAKIHGRELVSHDELSAILMEMLDMIQMAYVDRDGLLRYLANYDKLKREQRWGFLAKLFRPKPKPAPVVTPPEAVDTVAPEDA